MKEFIKKYYTILLLAIIYTTVAITVYIIWFNSMWHLWFVNVIAGILIFGLGVVITYLYIKAKIDKEKKEEAKDETDKKNS